MAWAASVHSASPQPASRATLMPWFARSRASHRPWGCAQTRSSPAGLALRGQGSTKDTGLPASSAELHVGARWRLGGLAAAAHPAPAGSPGRASDPWLPRRLSKPAGPWKQTTHPSTSQMRSRWLPGPRFPHIGLPLLQCGSHLKESEPLEPITHMKNDINYSSPSQPGCLGFWLKH